MAASALSGWNPGHDPWEDMPPAIPVGGGGAPPPPGATYLGAGGDPTLRTSFPGATPGRWSHPNLPALNDGWHQHPHSPYTPAWHATGYPYPHFHPTPAPHYAPLPGYGGWAPPPVWAAGASTSPWHGNIPLGDIPVPPTQDYPPAWYSHSPWPGGFGGVGETRGRGQKGVDWFAADAKRKRSKSRSGQGRRKSKSPHPAFPGVDSYFDHEDEYEDEGEGERWGPSWHRGDSERRRRKYENGERGTNWDLLDGFRGLSLGQQTPRKRSLSFNAVDRPAHHRRTISNPIYKGYHVTYEQHMDRYGHAAREGDLPYRPSSWRTDYSVKGGLMHALGVGSGLKRSISDVKEINDTQKRTLHPHLRYDPNATLPSISLDLRLNPSIPHFVAPALNLFSLPQSPHGVSAVDLVQFATHPPSSTMRLFHKRLPWYIDIDVSSRRDNSYITIQDIIYALFTTLTGQGSGGKSQVTAAEYWCGEMGDHVEATPPPPPPGALPGNGNTPLLRSITPLPLLGQKRAKHTAREQVSMSWRIRGRLAHHVTWAAWRGKGDSEEAALAEGAKAEQDELARGVRRVDWLAIGTNVDDQRAFRWIGLRKARRGMWEIVTEG
ncbi:hypothetical protein E1B28_008134 [Marasmius oreades]|uniref:DUF6699 domain-containing protein n=1 Tax=Marasmius oreades TaxID=181124 RepID=A0A9P7RYD4_9AGAR|nr:uncharacterized protein E1B28_008134 [Marasmius oreades]KAG7091733.1 hypothetical protein E1B28_008134 [Marasmius oreades]